MRLADLIRNNRPGAKPELWTRPVRALRQRALAFVYRAQGEEAWDRERVVTLAPDERVKMGVPLSDDVGRTIFLFGSYEYAPTQLVRAFLQPGDAFFDVGANFGYYALIAADVVGPRGKVIAFEPVAHVRARLEANVARNRFAQVEVRPEVVSRAAGTIELFEVPEKGAANKGISSATVRPPGSRAVQHEAVSLDQIVRDTKVVPALMKVDVEGHEGDVFAGARALMTGPDAPCVMFETHAPEHEIEPVRSLGYRIFVPMMDARGRVGLAAHDDGARPPQYRAWEAPNYFALKGARGDAFARRFAR